MIGSMSWAFGSVYGSRIELPSGMMAGAIEMLAAGIVLLMASALTGEKLTAMPDLSGFPRRRVSGAVWLHYRHQCLYVPDSQRLTGGCHQLRLR